MRAHMIVISRISREYAAQVGLAKNDDVVQALATERANQPLRYAILPGCPGTDRAITDPHRRKTPGDGMAVGAVIVATR